MHACLFLVLAAASEVIIVVREGDQTSEVAEAALIQQPPSDARILSPSRFREVLGDGGIVVQTNDDADAKKRFKAAREAAKQESDPLAVRAFLLKAIGAAEELSPNQLEFRQNALMIADQDLAKVLFTLDKKAKDIDAVLMRLAIRSGYAEQPSLSLGMQKRYTDIAELTKRSRPALLDIVALNVSTKGEISLDGGVFKKLLKQEAVWMSPGPHEAFTQWSWGPGWSRRFVVTSDGLSSVALTLNEGMERKYRVGPNGFRLRSGLIEQNEAEDLASRANVQEVWWVERQVPGRVQVSVYHVKDNRISRASVDVRNSETLPVPIVRMALDAARKGASYGEAVRDHLLTQPDLSSLAGPAAFGPDGTLNRPLFLIQIKRGRFLQVN